MCQALLDKIRIQSDHKGEDLNGAKKEPGKQRNVKEPQNHVKKGDLEANDQPAKRIKNGKETVCRQQTQQNREKKSCGKLLILLAPFGEEKLHQA